ncbi:MAG: N-acyl homoserine lactonase family protein [Actinomycetota bacterium]
MPAKLYLFECGTLRSRKELFTLNKDIGKPFEAPIPFFLITHNGKNILFDTGNNLEVAKNPKKHWGDIINDYYPVMNEQQFVVNQLETLLIKPEEIDYVILSHLHLDHAGGTGYFPNARYVVHKKELEWAFNPDCTQKSAYIMQDIDKNVNWFPLENEFKEAYDLLKDGVIKIYPTPGHTPGHMSILVNLEASRPIFLTSDSCYTEENLYENILPGLVWDDKASMDTMDWIRKLQKKENIEIIVGHDPAAWKRFNKAPRCYS